MKSTKRSFKKNAPVSFLFSNKSCIFNSKFPGADRFGSGRAKRVEPFTVGVVLVGVVYLAFHAVQFGLHMSLQNQVAENSNALNSTLAANAILEE